MDLSSFALWKFKKIEGVLKYAQPFDIFKTKFTNIPNCIEDLMLVYDTHSEVGTLFVLEKYNKLGNELDSSPFKEIDELLKRNNLNNIRTENRHSSSFNQD